MKQNGGPTGEREQKRIIIGRNKARKNKKTDDGREAVTGLYEVVTKEPGKGGAPPLLPKIRREGAGAAKPQAERSDAGRGVGVRGPQEAPA